MEYSERLMELFMNPKNVGTLDENDPHVGTGVVGSPVCGDVMKFQIKVDDEGRITDAKFKTFGCGSAIASASLATEWLKGRTIGQALQIKNFDIARELSLPPIKIHCSVLAVEAIETAVNDWRKKDKSKQSLVVCRRT